MFGHHCSDAICKFSTSDFYNAYKSIFFNCNMVTFIIK